MVQWVSAFGLNNKNKWWWWMWKVATCFGLTAQAWSEGCLVCIHHMNPILSVAIATTLNNIEIRSGSCYMVVYVITIKRFIIQSYNWMCLNLYRFKSNKIYARLLFNGKFFLFSHNKRQQSFCPGLPGWAGTRRNIHALTILIIIQSLSASSIAYSLFKLLAWQSWQSWHNLCPHPLWFISWSAALHLIFHTFLHPVSVFFL